MRAYLIIIFQIRQQHMSEVPLSEHNNVVKAFPSDRTDQPFGISILPRGARRRWSVASAHRSKSSDEDNISPVEVEQALVASHPAIEQAAVGIPDAVLGQRVFGFVKLADGTKDTVLSEILRNVAARLASYKVPEGLRIVDELPRNALSKVDRNMLQTMVPGTTRLAKSARPSPLG